MSGRLDRAAEPIFDQLEGSDNMRKSYTELPRGKSAKEALKYPKTEELIRSLSVSDLDLSVGEMDGSSSRRRKNEGRVGMDSSFRRASLRDVWERKIESSGNKTRRGDNKDGSKKHRMDDSKKHNMDVSKKLNMDDSKKYTMDRSKRHNMDESKKHRMDRSKRHNMDESKKYNNMDGSNRHGMDASQKRHMKGSNRRNMDGSNRSNNMDSSKAHRKAMRNMDSSGKRTRDMDNSSKRRLTRDANRQSIRGFFAFFGSESQNELISPRYADEGAPVVDGKFLEQLAEMESFVQQIKNSDCKTKEKIREETSKMFKSESQRTNVR